MNKEVEKKVIADFLRSPFCSYATTKVLSDVVGAPEDQLLLCSVLGFSSGVATMGDTCGAVNGGVVVLGRRFPDLPSAQLHYVCTEYFRRLEQRVGTPDCGKVHGGKHLTKNFRRGILTGKFMKCVKILRHSADVLTDLARWIEEGNSSFAEAPDYLHVKEITRHFENHSFHCAQSTISEIGRRSGMKIDHILSPSRGLCGGIGFNGTLCGAIAGGVLCLGLRQGVDLSRSTYWDTFRIVLHGLIKSDGLFRDARRFLPAKLYGQCQEVYQKVEERYGGVHCEDILGLKLDTPNGAQKYIEAEKIGLCRGIVQTVADTINFFNGGSNDG